MIENSLTKDTPSVTGLVYNRVFYVSCQRNPRGSNGVSLTFFFIIIALLFAFLPTHFILENIPQLVFFIIFCYMNAEVMLRIA